MNFTISIITMSKIQEASEYELQGGVFQKSMSSQISFPEADIAYIDDEYAISKLMKRILHHIGYNNVRIFNSTPSALLQIQKELQEQHRVPDLLISDFNLPYMSGVEFFHQVDNLCKKSSMTLPHHILVSGEQVSEEKNFLLKPFNRETFRKKIAEVLQQGTE